MVVIFTNGYKTKQNNGVCNIWELFQVAFVCFLVDGS